MPFTFRQTAAGTALFVALNILSMPALPQPVLETAAYTVRPDHLAGFLAARDKMMSSLQHYPGFREMRSYRSIDDGRFIVDYTTWASLADAHAAAERVLSDPSAVDFMSAIERMSFYGHARYLARRGDIGAEAPALLYEILRVPARPENPQSPGRFVDTAGRQQGFISADVSRFIAEDRGFVPPEMSGGQSYVEPGIEHRLQVSRWASAAHLRRARSAFRHLEGGVRLSVALLPYGPVARCAC